MTALRLPRVLGSNKDTVIHLGDSNSCKKGHVQARRHDLLGCGFKILMLTIYFFMNFLFKCTSMLNLLHNLYIKQVRVVSCVHVADASIMQLVKNALIYR